MMRKIIAFIVGVIASALLPLVVAYVVEYVQPYRKIEVRGLR